MAVGTMNDRIDAVGQPQAAASFAQGFVSSEAFRALFKEGMTLVEEAAAYLDGAGREEARGLERMPALAYAAESMRLTTRLMQIASWLLLQRAVSEGELTHAQAASEKRKVHLAAETEAAASARFEELPEALKGLVMRSVRLQARLLHLDRVLLEGGGLGAEPEASPVSLQMDRLREAFRTVE